MAGYLLPKKPLIKMLKDGMKLGYGFVDYSELLDHLCEGLCGDEEDHNHIQDMVYGDSWFQGHHEGYTAEQRRHLQKVFEGVRLRILVDLDELLRLDQFLCYRRTKSITSICFEVVE